MNFLRTLNKIKFLNAICAMDVKNDFFLKNKIFLKECYAKE